MIVLMGTFIVSMYQVPWNHQKEMKKRMMEIKKEFANKRDKIIDNNKPGE